MPCQQVNDVDPREINPLMAVVREANLILTMHPSPSWTNGPSFSMVPSYPPP
jgi:hypothetical protein